MDAAVRLAVPVGLVRWQENPTCYSPFVKVTYELRSAGWAAISPDQEPITAGEVAGGQVLWPSDFAESKTSCEVALVGEVLRAHEAPIRLRVGVVELEGATAKPLGPTAIGGRQRYFSDERARLAFPELPLQIVVEGAGATVRSAIAPPMPEVAIVMDRDWRSPRRIRMFVDAVLVDAHRSRCCVLYRGYFTHPGDIDEASLVVDALGKLDVTDARQLARWPRLVILMPEDFADIPAGADALPDATVADADDDEEPLTPRAMRHAAPSAAPPAAASPDVQELDDAEVELLHTADEEPREPETNRPPPSDFGTTLPLGMRSPVGATMPFAGSAGVPARKPRGIARTLTTEELAAQRAAVIPAGERTTRMRAQTEAMPATTAEEAAAQARKRLADRGLPFQGTPPSAPTFGPRPAPSRPSVRRPDPEESTAVIVLPERRDEDDEREGPPSILRPAPAPRPSAPPTPAPKKRGRFDDDEHTALVPMPGPAAPALPFASAKSPGLPAPPAVAAAASFTPAYGPPAPPVAASLTDTRMTDVHVEASGIQAPVWRPKEVEPARPEERSSDKVPTLTLDEYAAIRAELWAGDRPRREVLKARGLSELRWRAVERRWAAEIDAVSGDPSKLMPILSRLQTFSDARASASLS